MSVSEALPSYWLDRPSFKLTSNLEATFEAIFTKRVMPRVMRGVMPGKAQYIKSLPAPKWVFLCWLTDTKNILLHGSGNPNISLFEPRSPNEDSPDAFSKQKAVFAAGDGIWPIFYAIMDRENYRFRMLNSTLQPETSPGHYADMRYFFSITEGMLSRKPFRDGVIYILPKHGFVQQPPYELVGRSVLEPHFASPEPVRPLAKLKVRPDDFPFLKVIREHDEATVRVRAGQDP